MRNAVQIQFGLHLDCILNVADCKLGILCGNGFIAPGLLGLFETILSQMPVGLLGLHRLGHELGHRLGLGRRLGHRLRFRGHDFGLLCTELLQDEDNRGSGDSMRGCLGSNFVGIDGSLCRHLFVDCFILFTKIFEKSFGIHGES